MYSVAEIGKYHIWFTAGDQEWAEKKLQAEWVRSRACWRLPLTLGALRELIKGGGPVPPELIATGAKMRARADFLFKCKSEMDHLNEPKRLRPYQRADLHFLAQKKSAALFNEQRTGKTPTILTAVQAKGFKKILIVVPASIVDKWAREVEEWTAFVPVLVRGHKKIRQKLIEHLETSQRWLAVTSYETLRADRTLWRYILMDCMVIDEAHRIRNRKTQQTEAVQEIGTNAKCRYALTGTPAVKEGNDIFQILHFLEPHKYSSYWQWSNRYFEWGQDWMGKWVNKGYRRQRELEEEIALISTNRKQKEVMPWLPAKSRIQVPLTMGTKQEKYYRELEETMMILDGDIDTQGVLDQMIRLRQVCTCPEMLDLKCPNVKKEFILDWLRDNPDPVIIFSTFSSYLHKLYDRLKEEGYRPSIITGQVNAARRQLMVDDFQMGNTRVMLANIKAAGTGLTLDRATTTIFLDREFNPADNDQAEERMTPVSEERVHPLTVVTLAVQDTWDEIIETILEEKQSVVDVINSGGLRALKRQFEEVKARDRKAKSVSNGHDQHEELDSEDS